MTISKQLEKPFSKNKIEKFPLQKYIENISSDGFLIAISNNKTGTLFFKKGKLITGELENKFSLKIANEILKWDKGKFYYQKWESNFKIESNYINKLFYFIELLSYNAKISTKNFEFLFSEGAIVNTTPEIQESNDIFNILNKISSGTIINVKKTPINNGDFKIYFSELDSKNTDNNIVNNTNTEQTNKNIKSPFLDTIKEVQKNFDLKINSLCIYSISENKEIYNTGFKKTQINKLIKFENNINNVNKSDNKQILVNMNTHLLLSIFLKETKIFFMFKKEDFNMGIVFNIMLPKIYKTNNNINNINN